MPDWKDEIRARLAKLQIEPARETEIVDELTQHIDDRYEEFRAEGASEAEARRMALAELNDGDLMAADLRRTERSAGPEVIPPGAIKRGNLFAGFSQDLRYAGRTLRKNPGFTFFVTLTLALGIGANTAVFTLMNTVLLNPLPVRDPSRLVAIETLDNRTTGGGKLLPVSYLNLKDFEAKNEVFSDLAGYSSVGALTLTAGEKPERIFAEFVTANYFKTLGLRPALGRFFRADENQPGAHPVAVIGYAVWQHRFGGAPDILGRTLTVNSSVAVAVVGVAPDGFKGVTVLFGPDLWIPAAMTDQLLSGHKNALTDRGELAFQTAARLKPGVSIRQAQANVATIAAGLRREYPQLNQKHGISVRPLVEAAQGSDRRSLLFGSAVLMAVVGLVLLIACSNAASLFLARASGRRQEIAVRLALGANRKRLIRQLLTESMLLGLISGIAGLAFGYAGCRLLWSFFPAEVALNFVDPKMDGTVLVFAVAVSILTGIIFGIVPAMQSSRVEVVDALKEETRTAGRSRGRVTFRNFLLVGQVALSLVSLIAAALFLRSIQHAYAIDPGFQTAHLAVFMPNQAQAGYNQARTEQFYRDVDARVSATPGVASVTWSSSMPFWNRLSQAVSIEGQAQRRKEDAVMVVANTIDLNFFNTLGIPVLEGRDFNAADQDGAPLVAIVNKTMAEKYWPGQDPLGKRFQLSGDVAYRQIVGVARTANYTGLGEPPQPCIYLPMRQNFSKGMILYVRTQGSPAPLLTEVQRELRSIDPRLDVTDARTGAKIIDQALFSAKIGVGLLSVFGLLGLALASVGLYGIIAYSVNQRRREIGVRVALGAAQGSIQMLVIRQGMTLVGAGVLLGLAISLLLGRALSTLLYGVNSTDPISLFGASFVLIAVALLACYLPARRASRMDPLAALRDA